MTRSAGERDQCERRYGAVEPVCAPCDRPDLIVQRLGSEAADPATDRGGDPLSALAGRFAEQGQRSKLQRERRVRRRSMGWSMVSTLTPLARIALTVPVIVQPCAAYRRALRSARAPASRSMSLSRLCSSTQRAALNSRAVPLLPVGRGSFQCYCSHSAIPHRD